MPITKWRNLAINQTKAADVVLFNVKFSLHPLHFLVFRYDGRRTQGGIRMDKIAFLVADELMQQSVATIIQTYNEKLTQHSFRIKIEIIDFPRLIDTIPILCLFSSTNNALRSVPLRRNIRRSICSSTKTSCSTKTPARKSCVKKSSADLFHPLQ